MVRYTTNWKYSEELSHESEGSLFGLGKPPEGTPNEKWKNYINFFLEK